MWGPSPKMLMWAYKSLVVPSLAYGALVWGHSPLNATTLKNHGQLNRLAAIMTSPVRKSTPTAGLELKSLDLVFRDARLLDSLRGNPRTRWEGIGFQSLTGTCLFPGGS